MAYKGRRQARKVPNFVLNHFRIADPRIPVYSNVEGVVYKNASTIRSVLPKQIVSCVKWEQSMHDLFR